MDDRIAVSARIEGLVQGVSFRAWVRDESRRRGLAGWVRNEADGSVVALIAGPSDAVHAMEEVLWHGPPAARVSSVELTEGTADPWPETFDVRR